MKVVDSRKILIISLIIVFVVLLAYIIKTALADNEIPVSNLEELVTAMENGGNIKLTGDIELNDRVAFNSDAVIDLNGHSITTDKRITICANVTIKDTSSSKTGIIKNTANAESTEELILIGNETEGNLILESGTIETFGGKYTVWGYNGSMTMNGRKT